MTTGPRGDIAPIVGGLGKKVVRTPEPVDDWKPIPDKPHFWINSQGQISYRPPEPQTWIPVPIATEWP